jgi:hypothetical protein
MDWTAKEFAMIIAAAVTAGGAIAVAIINHRKKAAGEQKPAHPQPLVVIQNSAPIRITKPDETPFARLSLEHGSARPAVVSISHREIVERLRPLAPYQRDLIEKSYVGVRVKWRIVLKSVGETVHGQGHVFGDVADTKAAIECDGKMDDFRGLIHAADKEEIEIEGTIDLVSTAYTMLKDCTARRLKEPAASGSQ